MRATRELSIAASLLLVAYPVFFGGGPGNGSLPWLGIGALVFLLAALATVGLPGGLLSLAPLAALAGWLTLTIAWSGLPDRSWDYANRGAVYLLAAAIGLYLAPRRRELALGFTLLLAAVAVWSLAGKVIPTLYDYGTQEGARLRAPVGLWNQLALLGCYALPFALWRKRLEGTLLAYAWVAALLLTYSRGGLLTAVVVVAIWLAVDDDRIESAMLLACAVVPAAVVVGIAFALPGVTSDRQPLHVRWHDGLLFGVLLVLGAVAAAALQRLPRPRPTRALRNGGLVAAALVVAAGIAFLVVKGTGSGAVGQGGGRFGSTSSNFRFVWWEQAWHGFTHHVLAGTGAGSFHLTNLLYRHSFLDFTTEPHSLPLQFLSEAGLVGFVLFVLACAALLRPSLRRRRHELALGLMLPAFLLHGLVDVDWDFAAVSIPAFVAAGSLAGRPPARRVSPFAVVAAAGAAMLVAGSLVCPWLGNRWSDQASVAAPKDAIRLAKRARSVDPLLVEPLWWQALAQTRPQKAYALYAKAAREQPDNPQTWLVKARFELGLGCARLALQDLYRFVALDPQARPDQGGDDYRRALRLVDSGKPRC